MAQEETERSPALENVITEEEFSKTWFAVQVTALQQCGGELHVGLVRGRESFQVASRFEKLDNWVQKDGAGKCIRLLGKKRVYARVAGGALLEMKTCPPPSHVEVWTQVPDYWSGSPGVWRQGAPHESYADSGWSQCPYCRTSRETTLVRTSNRKYHKCIECGVLMETTEGTEFCC